MESRSLRGQVTLFVILGIALLFIIGIAIYLFTLDMPKVPINPVQFDEDTAALKTAMNACLGNFLKEGLIEMGKTGGFTNTDQISFSMIAYHSDGFEFTPNKMPYWRYLDESCPDSLGVGCIKSHKPYLCHDNSCPVDLAQGSPSIQGELERFIDENIAICLEGLSPDIYKITPKELPKTKLLISEEFVTAKLIYPLETTVLDTDETGMVKEFTAKHQVQLPDLYRFAQDIYDTESEGAVVEALILQLIGSYASPNGVLPPMRHLEFKGSERYWMQYEIKRVLEDDVIPYVNTIQLLNALESKEILTLPEYEEEFEPYAHGFLQKLMVKTGAPMYFLKGRLLYPYEDIYLNLGKKQMLRPKTIDIGFPFLDFLGFKFMEYTFRYDISFPFMVKLEDPFAFGGEGLSFTYAMEANIRDNLPVTNDRLVLSLPSENVLEWDEPQVLVKRPIKIITKNKLTGEPLTDVTVEYSCGFTSVVGATEFDGTYASITKNLPFCAQGGLLKFNKFGFMGSAIPFNNDEKSKRTKVITFELWPIREHKLSIVKRNKSQIATALANASQINSAFMELDKKDLAVFSFERVRDASWEEAVPLMGSFSFAPSDRELSLPVTEEDITAWYRDGKIDAKTRSDMLASLKNTNAKIIKGSTDIEIGMVPGRYKISAQLINYEEFGIPAEKIKSNIIPGQNFSSWMTGGLHEFEFEFDKNEVYSDDTLRLFVLEQGKPSAWSTLEKEFTPLDEFQAGKSELIAPMWIH